MEKQDILQIAEDAWSLYGEANEEKRGRFDQVVALAGMLVELMPVGDGLAEASNEKLAQLLGSLAALATVRPKLEFVGGKYRVRSTSAPE